MRNDIGIYLHIPFCRRKCDYCDFCSQSASEETIDRYLLRLIEEIDACTEKGRSVASVFFGGGTPTLLGVRRMETLVSSLCRSFRFGKDCEWTMEANPATVMAEDARGYLSLGINRVSIGVQSLADNELRAIGRIHTARDARECVTFFERAGAKRISLDLMYGLPSQTLRSFSGTLREAISMTGGHLSVYGLILEEGTPLFLRRAVLDLPTEDEEYAMYEYACTACADAGLRHYEISNYARPGEECRHNLRYWCVGDYLGFGVSAHGCVGADRASHTESLDRYLAGDIFAHVYETRSDGEIDAECVMLGLRTSFGVSREVFDRVVPKSKEGFLTRCEGAGYLVRTDGCVFLTDRGMYLSTGILGKILPDFVSMK